MTAVSIFAPAKINLFLAVTGRRADGFHELVSVVTPLDFGDTLRAEPADAVTLECDDPGVPRDETNLVLKAAAIFIKAAPKRSGGFQGANFFLEKRVPMGAGLGGGSSDAVAALRALNSLASHAVAPEALAEMAATLGSDCPLFLHDGPVVIRGRGERVTPLPETAARRLRGRRVLLFKPGFSVATPWAYARLAALALAEVNPPRSKAKTLGVGAAEREKDAAYLPEADAEERLSIWLSDATRPAEALLFNNMELSVFAKFLALPALLANLRVKFGLVAQMTGSGSACFAFLAEDAPVDAITETVRAAWGSSAFVTAARLA